MKANQLPFFVTKIPKTLSLPALLVLTCQILNQNLRTLDRNLQAAGRNK